MEQPSVRDESGDCVMIPYSPTMSDEETTELDVDTSENDQALMNLGRLRILIKSLIREIKAEAALKGEMRGKSIKNARNPLKTASRIIERNLLS